MVSAYPATNEISIYSEQTSEIILIITDPKNIDLGPTLQSYKLLWENKWKWKYFSEIVHSYTPQKGFFVEQKWRSYSLFNLSPR